MPPAKRKRTAKQRYGKKRQRTSSTVPISQYYNQPESKEQTTTIIRSPGPVPDRIIAKHKYVDEISADGTRIDWEYNLNSTFSPRYSPSGGHQPYARDTYAGLYNRYRVFAVRYKISFDAVATATGSYRAAILWNNILTSENNYTLVAERPHSRSVVFAYQNSKVLSGHLSLPRINGQTKTSYMGDDRFQATAGTSPSENIMLHIVLTDNGGTAVASSVCVARVELTYHTEWFDPLLIAQS